MGLVSQAWSRSPSNFTEQRDAFLAEFGLSTGLRVAEMADLACQDLQVEGEGRSVVVRCGKGKKRRVVRISGAFRHRCLVFLEAKRAADEPLLPDSPVFRSPATGLALTRRALQKAFKRTARKAGLSPVYSIHALRHTYGTQLCKASGNNLRLVQQQMGHESIETTAIYLHVENEQLEEAVRKLSERLGSRFP
jgi:integrase/recombinase XerD